MNQILPKAVRVWINDGHDEEENLIAFFILGSFALFPSRRSGRAASGARPAAVRWVDSRAVRMAALMALVCAIELVQLFIPGRISDLNDVCTGWSGIFAAWLLCLLLEERAKKQAHAGSHPD
ncbi:MAG: VanZ family protein [Chthoniobacteraceae bacterium]